MPPRKTTPATAKATEPVAEIPDAAPGADLFDAPPPGGDIFPGDTGVQPESEVTWTEREGQAVITVEGRNPDAAEAFMSAGGPGTPWTKTAQVYAIEADAPVIVHTPEGEMAAKAGDYILSDIPPTHLWPVRREVFQATYRPADGAEDQDHLDWINVNPEAAIVALTEGGHLEETITQEIAEIESAVHSSGEINPTSGLYRSVGPEIALSAGERFPPPPYAQGWVLVRATERKGDG